MGRVATYDELCSLLVDEVVKQVPISVEEKDYLEALDAWTRRMGDLARHGNGNSKLSRAEIAKLLTAHQAARPKRKIGRPKSMVPPRRVIEEHLTKYLTEKAIKELPNTDPIHLVRSIAKRILEETATT